ncbi:ribokinase [Schleiferilactobacillus perolens]|uniref:ribokinase n=1 Tax=Schleiferilactobacillus perolens TaxID=100468 RepID=UPI0023559305|nr:ribokinase [Schleiferilactobacillus perolens]MCI2169959.1 ribokinase [Schleiferilactobacillus perolens]
MNTVTVIGSINVDNILHIQALPKPGETIAMSGYSTAGGGKGANQAIAAARSGAKTAFIGAVGNDANGEYMKTQLLENGINVQAVKTTSEAATGQAYILLQSSGQNSIIIDHGANAQVTVADVDAVAAAIQSSTFLVTEFETPLPADEEAFQIARAAGVKTILNPAPAVAQIPESLLRLTDIIVPNETESQAITGISVDDEPSLKASAEYYHKLGVETVIITLGDRGAYVASGNISELVPAYKVQAVDTTAAGDTFIGALAAELRPDGSNLLAAVRYASRAASLTVQKLGAFPSIPLRKSVLLAQKE